MSLPPSVAFASFRERVCDRRELPLIMLRPPDFLDFRLTRPVYYKCKTESLPTDTESGISGSSAINLATSSGLFKFRLRPWPSWSGGRYSSASSLHMYLSSFFKSCWKSLRWTVFWKSYIAVTTEKRGILMLSSLSLRTLSTLSSKVRIIPSETCH